MSVEIKIELEKNLELEIFSNDKIQHSSINFIQNKLLNDEDRDKIEPNDPKKLQIKLEPLPLRKSSLKTNAPKLLHQVSFDPTILFSPDPIDLDVEEPVNIEAQVQEIKSKRKQRKHSCFGSNSTIFAQHSCFRYISKIIPIKLHQKNSLIMSQETTDDETYGNYIEFCPFPFTMLIISIAQITIFALRPDYDKILSYDHCKRHEIWRFLTYMLVHGNIYHLISNLLIQVFLGIFLELVHCWWRITLLYLSGVLAGSFGHSLVTPSLNLCGASAGVFALLFAHMANILLKWDEMTTGVAQLFIFVAYSCTEFFLAFFIYKSGDEKNTSNIAHLSGALAGLFVGIYFLVNLKVSSWEKKLSVMALTLSCIFFLTCVIHHISTPNDTSCS